MHLWPFSVCFKKKGWSSNPNTFHVFQHRTCVADESSAISLDDIKVDGGLNYVERPIAILDRKTNGLRNKEVKLVKVKWQHRRGSKWTWEPEEEMREHYPELFSATDFEGEV